MMIQGQTQPAARDLTESAPDTHKVWPHAISSIQSSTKATAETPLHKKPTQESQNATDLHSGLGKSGLYLLEHMEGSVECLSWNRQKGLYKV